MAYLIKLEFVMNEMVQKLMEEEKRLTEKEQLFESAYRSPKIDIEELIRLGYVSAEDYHNSHK